MTFSHIVNSNNTLWLLVIPAKSFFTVMKISYYKNFYDIQTQLVEVTEVFRSVTSNLLKKQTDNIRGLVMDSLEQRKAKKQLPFVSFRCQMLPTRTKNAPTLIPTGLADIDFDHVIDPQGLKEKLKADPYAHFIYFSPRMGVKVVVKHDNLSPDNEVFHQFYQQLQKYFSQYNITDSTVCSIASCCALSCDRDAYYNPNSKVFHFDSSKVNLKAKMTKPYQSKGNTGVLTNKPPFWLNIDKAYDELDDLYPHLDFTPGHRNDSLNKMAYISASKGIDPQQLKIFMMGKIFAPDFDEDEIWRTIMSAYKSKY